MTLEFIRSFAVDLRMARYETPGQIAVLFIGAALVSIAVIFVLRLEAQKRSESITTSENIAIIVAEIEPVKEDEVKVQAATDSKEDIKEDEESGGKFNIFESLSKLKQKIRSILHLDTRTTTESLREKRSLDSRVRN